MRFLIALFAAALLSAAIARAAGAPQQRFSDSYQGCQHRFGGTLGMRECYGAESERQDKELNAVYGKLEALLAPEDKAALRKAERAWLAYRDSECAWQGSVERGGTLALTIEDDRRVQLTGKRIDSLRERLKT